MQQQLQKQDEQQHLDQALASPSASFSPHPLTPRKLANLKSAASVSAESCTVGSIHNSNSSTYVPPPHSPSRINDAEVKRCFSRLILQPQRQHTPNLKIKTLMFISTHSNAVASESPRKNININ
jgi:hypothetical protein